MMKKSLKSIKKINKFANIITKRGYAFDVVKRENENLLYIRQDGKEICCWRDIKARNTETVGTYNFVATTSVQEFTPSASYDPFIVDPRETSRTLYRGNVNGDKPQNTSVIRSTDVYPLAVSAQEYLELNDTRYERNRFYHIETPYIPDYESVRRISDEAHIPFRPWSLGYIPQTFEDERYISEPAQEIGNSQPLRAVVLNSQFTPGEVSSIKVLSAFGFYDNTVKSQITNKFRWIAVAIRSDDPLAAQTNDLDDLQNNFPWFMAGFRMYQTFYPSLSVVERDRQNILTKLLSSKEFSYIGNAFPNAKRYTHNLTGSIYSKRDSDLKNEWWVLGQPQFTEEALTIVEKSHKKFTLRNHENF